MRGQWNLREWELDHWKNIIRLSIDRLNLGVETIDLSDKDINPYQVQTVLEALGWEHDEEADINNGWEMDFWMYFRHPDSDKILVIAACGMRFSLELYYQEVYV